MLRGQRGTKSRTQHFSPGFRHENPAQDDFPRYSQSESHLMLIVSGSPRPPCSSQRSMFFHKVSLFPRARSAAAATEARGAWGPPCARRGPGGARRGCDARRPPRCSESMTPNGLPADSRIVRRVAYGRRRAPPRHATKRALCCCPLPGGCAMAAPLHAAPSARQGRPATGPAAPADAQDVCRRATLVAWSLRGALSPLLAPSRSAFILSHACCPDDGLCFERGASLAPRPPNGREAPLAGDYARAEKRTLSPSRREGHGAQVGAKIRLRARTPCADFRFRLGHVLPSPLPPPSLPPPSRLK